MRSYFDLKQARLWHFGALFKFKSALKKALHPIWEILPVHLPNNEALQSPGLFFSFLWSVWKCAQGYKVPSKYQDQVSHHGMGPVDFIEIPFWVWEPWDSQSGPWGACTDGREEIMGWVPEFFSQTLHRLGLSSESHPADCLLGWPKSHYFHNLNIKYFHIFTILILKSILLLIIQCTNEHIVKIP